MIDDVLHDIPIEYRDRFEQLVGEVPRDLSVLRKDVETYLQTVKQVGLMVKLLDMNQAQELAESAIALIDHAVSTDVDAEQRALVQAAVRYFVIEEEDEEITGVLGFDDDVAVVNAVCRALGRVDLIVALNRQD